MNRTTASGVSQTAQSSSYHKGVDKHRRVDVRTVQNILLIWLDGNIDENRSDCRNTIRCLRDAVNNVNTFTDNQKCIQFLEDMADEQICMIISGAFGQQIVPCVHNLSQVDSIFIFCGNKKYHEGWAKDWSKIKGVFTKIEPICEALEQTARRCEQNAISMSMIDDDNGGAEKTRDRLDPSFMYTQIMKEILLTISFEKEHIDQFIQHCREAVADNDKQLKYVNELAHSYDQHTPIWWYTRECFLYPMLNRALRTMNADLMIKMGFFISDLHQHIEKLHQEQFGSHESIQHLTVYRGQGMTNEAYEKMLASKDGLISFNSFLSTSKDGSTSLDFARRALTDDRMMGVLFVMNIDPARSSIPFASVVDVSYFGKKEDEVLFSMHAVFRIGEITPIDGNARLIQVQLNLASDQDNDLRQLFDYIRKESSPDDKGWYRLGLVLGRMGEFAKAHQVLEILLRQTTEENAKASIYGQLGIMKAELGDNIEAIAYSEKSIEIEEKQIPRNDQNLTYSYTCIGSVYFNMGDYPKALSSHEKVLAIRQQSLPPTHLSLAQSYNNIGNVYAQMGDYSKALSSYEKALIIRQRTLPSTHPNLAESHNNIGNVYYKMGDYPKALSSHKKALVMRQQSLPSTHPDVADSHSGIGIVYHNMRDFPNALSSFEEALAIRQKSLPPTHPGVAQAYNNIGNVHAQMGDYPKALSSYNEALSIEQQSLPVTHPSLALSYGNIGIVYKNMGDHAKAISSHEKALAIQQQSLPPTHPDLATTYSNLGVVYGNMGNYAKAYSCFERALDIAQRSLPANHPDLQNYRTVLIQMQNFSVEVDSEEDDR